MPPDINQILALRDSMGKVLQNLVAPLYVPPTGSEVALPVDTGYGRMSLTYAPPVTFVKAGDWQVGDWVPAGPGGEGVGYFQVKLKPGVEVYGTEFEVHDSVPGPRFGVKMTAEIPEGGVSIPVLNPDSTYTNIYRSTIQFVEKVSLGGATVYRTRTEFDLEYRVTFNGGKTWSEAEYVIRNIQHYNGNIDAIVWGGYEVLASTLHGLFGHSVDPKIVWKTPRTDAGMVGFPPSASYPIRNQQTAWAAMRQMGVPSKIERMGNYLAGVMVTDRYLQGWRPDYMDFMFGWTPLNGSYDDVFLPGHIALKPGAFDFYLMSSEAWYQVQFRGLVPTGPGSYPYRDRTAAPSTSAFYRTAVWPYSRAFRLKAAMDLLWRFGESRLQDAWNILSNDGGWDSYGPGKTLLGPLGSIPGSATAYKSYWLGAFAMCANMVWRYATFAGHSSIQSQADTLCHDSAQRILDVKVPDSGIYTEIVRAGLGSEKVERMHPDIVGWIFDAYDYDLESDKLLSKAWGPIIAGAGEWAIEGAGIVKPNQPDWKYGPNVSYESMLMCWQALNMYVSNFGGQV